VRNLELGIAQDLVELENLLLVESSGVTSAAVRRGRPTATARRTTVEATSPAATTATATAEVASAATTAEPKKLKRDILFVEARSFIGFRYLR
jgi:hypothetical protein